MKIGIKCRGFSLTSTTAGHVSKRLELLLRRGIRGLRRVDVTLSNLKGPRGAVDKRCLIKVGLDGLRPVVIEDVQPDLYMAIDRAASRAARTVVRRAQAHGWVDEQCKGDKQVLLGAV